MVKTKFISLEQGDVSCLHQEASAKIMAKLEDMKFDIVVTTFQTSTVSPWRLGLGYWLLAIAYKILGCKKLTTVPSIEDEPQPPGPYVPNDIYTKEQYDHMTAVMTAPLKFEKFK